ncbi:hypothetical protein K438DRAFT_2026517 [Mycena galopus ATCC 62051]|nr:hypothetical protein K438DRAFT_2026517 [Mycena galopus ATCC 62051]
MTRQNGLRLRTAQLERTAALDNWLLQHITPNTLSLPTQGLGPHEGLCMVFMSVKEGTVDGAFKNPDTYRLLLNVEANVNDYPTTSPLLCLGSFVGSNEDSDAPLTFAATLSCGMTDIKVESTYSANISLRMCLWARQVAAGTQVEEAVTSHCDQFTKPSRYESQVSCLCPECDGEMVSLSKRNRHEARERRESSMHATVTLPSTASAPTVAHSLAPQSVHRMPTSFVQLVLDDPPSFISEPDGSSYSQGVEASGELFPPISLDDWELPPLNSESDPEDEESGDGPPPADDENDPDPFYLVPQAPQRLPTATEIHPNRAVYLIYVVVFWLHSQFHLPFRACNVLLAIFALALQAGGAPIHPPIRTTLPTVIAQLGAEPSIQILPVCPGCLEVFPLSTPTTALCSRCSHPLFPPQIPTPSQKRNNTAPANPRPYLQFPTKSLAEQLATLLSVEGLEDEIERSLDKAKARTFGMYKNIFDGNEVVAGGLPRERLQKEYLKCTTKSARDAFVKKYATRWSELHRLPYFNLCEMIVIDPMHNLFLGVVKTHFYHIWVQLNVLRKTKELRTLHALLDKLKLPADLGHLPSLIGEPAGGSLTADQWLVFATVVAPLIIPQLWQEYIPEESPQELAQRRAREIAATLEAKRAAAAAARQAHQAAPGKRTRKPTARAAAMDIDPAALDAGANDESDDDSYGLNPTQQKKRKRQQQQDKAANSIEEDEARDNATPSNLHPDDPKNFLKLSSALKVLVAREITEEELTQSDTLIRSYCAELVDLYGPELNLGAQEPVGSELRRAVELMYHATADDRGTVQALARELDTARENGGITFQLSTRAEKGQLPPQLYFYVLEHFQIRLPDLKLHSFIDLAPSPDSIGLEPNAILFDHVIINQSRYLASSRAAHPHSSFIALRSSAGINTRIWVGELRSILAIQQPGSKAVHRFGYVRWFRPTTIDISRTVWSEFSSLNVQVWDADTYLLPTDNGPEPLIQLEDIFSHVVRLDVSIRGQKYWATIPTGKVCVFDDCLYTAQLVFAQ